MLAPSRLAFKLMRLFATVALGFAVLLLTVTTLQAAAGGTTVRMENTDPAVVVTEVSGTLPISMTSLTGMPLVVYFNNSSAGVLSLTFEVSGTPALTFTAGSAFAIPEQSFTSATSSWLQPVTYPVAASSADYHLVQYTATNTTTARTTLVLNYIHDVTSPHVAFVAPGAGSILTTAHLPTYVISGTTQDADAGVQTTSLSTGTGAVVLGAAANWKYVWPVPLADDEVYTFTATAVDWVENVQSVVTTVTVDTVAPVVGAPVPHAAPWVTSTIVYTWTTSQNNAHYEVNVTNTQGLTWLLPSNSEQLVFTQAYSENAGYTARVRGADQQGNWGLWSQASVVVTPDLTAPGTTALTITHQSSYFYVPAGGRSLYYTNSLPAADSFTVRVTGVDTVSGLDLASFSAALGSPTSIDSTPPLFTANYDVAPGETRSGVIAANVFDRAGNSNLVTFTYQLDNQLPSSNLTSTVSVVHGQVPVRLDWFATDQASGVYSITLLAQRNAGPWIPYADRLVAANQISGSFYFTPTAADVLLRAQLGFATIARDHLGNQEPQPTTPDLVLKVDLNQLYLPVILRNYPPPPQANLIINGGRTYTYRRLGATLQFTDTTTGDTIAEMRLRNADSAWGIWQPFTTTVPFDLSPGNGLKTVYAQLRGALGGESEVHASILLFENGDFEQNLAVGWTSAQNPLPVTRVLTTSDATPIDGQYAALLGSTQYSCKNVPLGYAGLTQMVVIPAGGAHLKFQYFMWTQDAAPVGRRNLDSFEVYINMTLKYDDANRYNVGLNCSTWRRVPGDQNPRGVGQQVAGWYETSIDLKPYAGQTITVFFANYTRYDKYYNTYTYLDDVRLEP